MNREMEIMTSKEKGINTQFEIVTDIVQASRSRQTDTVQTFRTNSKTSTEWRKHQSDKEMKKKRLFCSKPPFQHA